jgi:hypothetical protein
LYVFDWCKGGIIDTFHMKHLAWYTPTMHRMPCLPGQWTARQPSRSVSQASNRPSG